DGLFQGQTSIHHLELAVSHYRGDMFSMGEILGAWGGGRRSIERKSIYSLCIDYILVCCMVLGISSVRWSTNGQKTTNHEQYPVQKRLKTRQDFDC
ncbi:MAG: hypothetical protein ABJL67_00245, partial [Sulfitobacter sp.]